MFVGKHGIDLYAAFSSYLSLVSTMFRRNVVTTVDSVICTFNLSRFVSQVQLAVVNEARPDQCFK